MNSLRYNVNRDAFNYSIYSYSSWQQTYFRRRHANIRMEKKKYIISNSKTKSFLYEANSFNYLIFSKDLDFIHGNWVIVQVCPRSKVCQVLLWKPATQRQSNIFPSVSLWFHMPTVRSSASEFYKIIQMYTVQWSYLDIENCALSSQQETIHMDMQDPTQDQLRQSFASPLSVRPQLKSSSWKSVRILCPFMSFWVMCWDQKVYIITHLTYHSEIGKYSYFLRERKKIVLCSLKKIIFWLTLLYSILDDVVISLSGWHLF